MGTSREVVGGGRRKRTGEDKSKGTGRVFGNGYGRKRVLVTTAMERMKGKGLRGKMERQAPGEINRRASGDIR